DQQRDLYLQSDGDVWSWYLTLTRQPVRSSQKARVAGARRCTGAASGSSERAAPRRRSIAIRPGPSEEDPGAAHVPELGQDPRRAPVRLLLLEHRAKSLASFGCRVRFFRNDDRRRRRRGRLTLGVERLAPSFPDRLPLGI